MQTHDFPTHLSQPALRALHNAGITRLEQLTRATRQEVLAFHGMGPNGIKKLEEALADRGLSFVSEKKG